MSNNMFKMTIGFNTSQETAFFGMGGSQSYTIKVNEDRKEEILQMYEKCKSILPIRLSYEPNKIIYINMKNVNYITVSEEKSEAQNNANT